MGDFLYDHLGWVVGALMLGLLALFFVAADADMRAHDEFMAECEAHKPRFECVAMWRAGESHVIPVTVPVFIR